VCRAFQLVQAYSSLQKLALQKHFDRAMEQVSADVRALRAPKLVA
jgi:hypothetical protein